MNEDEVELTSKLLDETRRGDELEKLLEGLIDIVGARWNGDRWIVPLPLQEPTMRDLAPEELLRNSESSYLFVSRHHNLWHVTLMMLDYKEKCLRHGKDKERVIKEGLQKYNERFGGGEET